MSESARGNFWMTSMMKAAVKVKAAPKSTEVKSVAVPNLRADEVLIRVAVSSICGTDVRGSAVAVFGRGPIGLTAVARCCAMGARGVIAVGNRNQYRMILAKTVAAHSVRRSGPRLVEEIMDLTSDEGVDDALEFSGSEEALKEALSVVRPAGGIHILGFYTKPVTFDLSEMVTKGVSMHGIHGRLMYK